MDEGVRSTRNTSLILLCLHYVLLWIPPTHAHMAFRQQYEGLSSSEVKLFRDFEKVQCKLARNESSRVFNETCLREGLLPTYTNVRLHDNAARNEQFTVKFRQQLIKRQLENSQTIYQTLKTKADQLHIQAVV